MLSPNEQLRMINKGVETLVSKEELLAKLKKSYDTNKPLTIKLGLDPSAPDIHLGHAVVLRKIRQMQQLGHRVVIIIGDFTGKIGDPTGKAKGRVALNDTQVRENAETYCNQIFKILDKEKTEVRFNSEWLKKLTFEDVIKLASTTTVARMLERDDFQNRYQNKTAIGVHEFLYPLMQGYDSVALGADIELGGTDQTFNILMGRTIQKTFHQEEQVALFMPLLEGLDGVEKMSKSLGNYVGISEPAPIMFKKVMELNDHLIIKYFELATDEHPDEIDKIRTSLKEGVNPRDAKLRLAETIVGLYHSKKELKEAMEYYDMAFSKKETPDNIPQIMLPNGNSRLRDIIGALVEMRFVASKSEFYRMMEQDGVRLDDRKISQAELDLSLHGGEVLKIGKKRFVRFLQ